MFNNPFFSIHVYIVEVITPFQGHECTMSVHVFLKVEGVHETKCAKFNALQAKKIVKIQ